MTKCIICDKTYRGLLKETTIPVSEKVANVLKVPKYAGQMAHPSCLIYEDIKNDLKKTIKKTNKRQLRDDIKRDFF